MSEATWRMKLRLDPERLVDEIVVGAKAGLRRNHRRGRTTAGCTNVFLTLRTMSLRHRRARQRLACCRSELTASVTPLIKVAKSGEHHHRARHGQFRHRRDDRPRRTAGGHY